METEQLLQKICETFYYTSDGKVFRKQTGKEAGYVDKTTGYRRVGILNKKVYTHQVVYFLSHGSWPSLVDHIDRNKLNNRPENLRVLTHRENICNSNKITKASYVCFHKASGKWAAFTPRNYSNQRYLGLFETEQEAREAVKKERKYGTV